MNSYADHAKRSMGKFPKGDNMLMDNMKAFEILGLEPQNGKLTTEQIAKVKGLGCLKDKRYDNIFNFPNVIHLCNGNSHITERL